MRRDVVAAVGDGGAQVGNLQGRKVHLALSDGDTDDGESVPGTAVGLVIEGGVGDESAFLAGKVHAQFVSEAHAYHIVFPAGHGVLHGGVFLAVSEHVIESPAEETVARCADGGHNGDGRSVGVAAYGKSAEVESVGAGIWCGGGDDSLLQEGERLAGLEGGAGRILSHDASVQQRLVGVAAQQQVVLSALAAYGHSGVIGGAGNHAQNLSRAWLNGHNASALSRHQPFAKRLQLDVDAQREVAAGYGSLVKLSVLVSALDSSSGIAQQDFRTLDASQRLFVASFHALFANVVASLVISIGLNVVRIGFAHVAQDVCRVGILVLADAAFLDVETGEKEHLFLERADFAY